MLEELLASAKAGKTTSLVFIAEQAGKRRPRTGVVGRLRSDPARVIGELRIMENEVAEFSAVDLGFGHSK